MVMQQPIRLTDQAWDEQVVNNIKIKKIHILSDELDDEDIDDIKTFVETHRIPSKSWDDSSALQTHIAGITRK